PPEEIDQTASSLACARARLRYRRRARRPPSRHQAAARVVIKAMKTGMSLDGLAAEIERCARAKQDLVVPVEKLEAVVVEAEGYPELGLAVANGEKKTFRLMRHAHTQLGNYTGIPPREYWRMTAKAPGLLTREVNRSLKSKAKDCWMLR